jgi:galactonate dehydratase
VLIKELEPYRPLFIEEPVLAEQAEYYPKLAAQTHIPIAAGERMFSRFEFKRVLEAGGLLFCSRTCRMPAVLPNATKLPEWRKPTMWRWRRTVRWAHCVGGLPACRLCLPQRCVPGAKHGDSL